MGERMKGDVKSNLKVIVIIILIVIGVPVITDVMQDLGNVYGLDFFCPFCVMFESTPKQCEGMNMDSFSVFYELDYFITTNKTVSESVCKESYITLQKTKICWDALKSRSSQLERTEWINSYEELLTIIEKECEW